MSAEAVRVPPGRQVEPFTTGSSGRRDGGRSVALEGSHHPSAAAPGSSLDGGPNNSARCARIEVVSTETGEVIGLPCGSWRCDQCGVSNRRAFAKRLRLGLAVQGDRELPKFLTLTSRPGESPHESRAALASRFREVRRRLERSFPGAEVEYGGMVELTQRGAVHLHVVLRGVPFMPQRTWSTLVARCGFGPVVWIEKVHSGGVGAYVAKLGRYMTKAAGAGWWPPHFRRVRFSRDWAPGWVVRGRRPRQPGQPAEFVLHRVLKDRWYLADGGWLDRRAGQGRSESGSAACGPLTRRRFAPHASHDGGGRGSLPGPSAS